MKLTFDQIMRLLLLLSGVVFFGVGVWMIQAGIKAEGSIDIRSEVLSGSLKTGSAGLFVTFFAFFMILASVLFSKSPVLSRPKPETSAVSPIRILLRILFTLYALTVAAYLLARSADKGEQLVFGFAFVGFTVASFCFSIFTFLAWAEELPEEPKDAGGGVVKK
jgi:hypothetical protein